MYVTNLPELLRGKHVQFLIVSLATVIFVRLGVEFAVGSLPGDAYIFSVVGRGIVNGLTPYRDLFETKPVGAFLLSALSLRLTDDFFLLRAVNIALAVAIPFVLFAFRRQFPQERRTAFLALGFLLVAYNAKYAFISSFYPTVSLFLYALSFRLPLKAWQRDLIGLGTSWVAFQFREPTILLYVAIAFLLAPSVSAFIRTGVAAIGGALLAIGAMAALGYLEPYRDIYLRNLLFTRFSETSMLVRGLEQWSFVMDLARFSLPLLLALAIVLTALVVDAIRGDRTWWRLVRIFVPLYCMNVAIQSATESGSAYPEYCMPVLFALTLLWAFSGTFHSIRQFWGDFHVPAITVITVVGMLLLVPRLLAGLPGEVDGETSAVAAQVDKILDACGVDRYLYAGSNFTLTSLTRHSPMGPLFFFQSYFLRDESLLSSLPANAERAQVILFDRSFTIADNDPFLQSQLQRFFSEVEQNFTQKTPACAPFRIRSKNFYNVFRVGM